MNTGPTTQMEHRLTKLLADCDMDRLALLRVARAAEELIESDRWRGLSALEEYINRIRIALKEAEHLLGVDK